VPLIEGIAKAKSVPFTAIRFKTTEEAQNAPAPSTTYCLFFNGVFLTNEILAEKKFAKLLTEKGL
jgi:Na+(H+)/acetate symporter ActP